MPTVDADVPLSLFAAGISHVAFAMIPNLSTGITAGRPNTACSCYPQCTARALLACRVEYIRLLEQALSQLGFEGAAQQLQQESGIALEAPEIGRLRAAVLAGDFTEAVRVLGQLPLSDYEYRRAEFALLEQNFLEVCLHPPPEPHGMAWMQHVSPLRLMLPGAQPALLIHASTSCSC